MRMNKAEMNETMLKQVNGGSIIMFSDKEQETFNFEVIELVKECTVTCNASIMIDDPSDDEIIVQRALNLTW